MPKLIDAEKLEEYKADCCVSLTEWQQGWNDAIDMIMSETPTVEAIPKEWIKDYVGSGVSDDIFQRNRRFVLNMIKDWEEENG